MYLWAGGIHVNIRLEEHKLCLLVMIGVRTDGRQELIALADGYRESAESWADLLRGCARRGLRAPMLAVGDGALGFWSALREVFPEAVAEITDDLEELPAFYDYPAEHWVHLRTTNPIESTFATVRHRIKATKGPGSRAAGLAMAFKLIGQPRTAGARAAPRISSPWSVPEQPSSTANWWNDPARRPSPKPLKDLDL